MSDRDTEIIANISREKVPDVPPPTPEELVAWTNGKDCPDAALEEMAYLAAGLMVARPPDVWPTPPQHISTPAYMYMSLALDADSRAILTLHFYFEIAGERVDPPSAFLPSAFLVDVTDTWNDLDRETRSEHPLAPLVQAWHHRPTPAEPERRAARIFAGQLAMIESSDRRAGRLFGHAAHTDPANGQLVLPGFAGAERQSVPCLPIELYDLGITLDGPGRGAPLALRLWIESVLSVPEGRRDGRGNPTALNIPLRELLGWLYPNRRPSPAEYWPRLMAAAEALDACRIPWYDPDTGKGGLRRVVSVGNIPRGPDALDDDVQIIVNLPPGSGNGPLIDNSIRRWGVKSAPAYRLLLNLAYAWYEPGRTHFPAGPRKRRHWTRVKDPDRYPELSDEELIRLAYPPGRSSERNLRAEVRRLVKMLEDTNELQIVGGRILPPDKPEQAGD